MIMNENEKQKLSNKNDEIAEWDDIVDGELDLDELERKLTEQINLDEIDLDALDSDIKNINNPSSLGESILDNVWSQFTNQIGLDITNETLIQKYDREHPESYDEVSKKVMQDKRYKDANNEMKKQQSEGKLTDSYTGKQIGRNENANLDHTVSRKEIFENQRRRQANLSTEELANRDANLNATNESLNKSKGAKSVNEYLEDRELREKALKEQNERANKKIDESNMSEAEKRAQKEKNNKALEDKLAADEERMRRADKTARRDINKQIAKGVVKETGKKASKDSLKMMAVQALSTLLKEIVNGFIRFLKAKAKSFKVLLDEMKEAFKRFISHIGEILKTGATSFVGTILTEIFGPVVSLFKKLASLIKQGIAGIREVISYLRSDDAKKSNTSERAAAIGKIVTGILLSGGAIFLGELIEKGLMSIPFMSIEIPLLGTLANITGMLLASIVSGIVGAIILHLIDTATARKQEENIRAKTIEKNNKVLHSYHALSLVQDAEIEKAKMEFARDVITSHTELKDNQESFSKEIEEFVEESKKESNERNQRRSDLLKKLTENQN